MLDIYHSFESLEGKCEVGMIYQIFMSDMAHNEFESYDSIKEKDICMHLTKTELVMCNLEAIIQWANKLDGQTELTRNALERLQDCLNWAVAQKEVVSGSREKFKKMCSVILKTEKFMTTLVNSLKSEERRRSIYYWKMYYGFIRSEVNNGKTLSHTGKEG